MKLQAAFMLLGLLGFGACGRQSPMLRVVDVYYFRERGARRARVALEVDNGPTEITTLEVGQSIRRPSIRLPIHMNKAYTFELTFMEGEERGHVRLTIDTGWQMEVELEYP